MAYSMDSRKAKVIVHTVHGMFCHYANKMPIMAFSQDA